MMKTTLIYSLLIGLTCSLISCQEANSTTTPEDGAEQATEALESPMAPHSYVSPLRNSCD